MQTRESERLNPCSRKLNSSACYHKKEKKEDAGMRKLSAFAVAFFVFAGTSQPQDHKARIFLTGTDQTLANRSNVSAAEIGKSLDKH